MSTREKINTVGKIKSDIDYLSGEYSSIALFGSAPDGNVEFYRILDWLTDNKHFVEHMIKTGSLLNDIAKSENPS